MRPFTTAAALSFALLAGTLAAPAAQAASTSYTFNGLLQDGPLAGQGFSGSFAVIMLYFGITSFWRARKIGKTS